MAIPTSGYASQSVTNPGGALTDFTLIINLADVVSDQPDFSTGWNTDTGGYGKATKGDGTTELATDWIDLDNSGETGWVRVKWSGSLASSGTQTVRLWPPNTANDLYAADDTYGSDNAYDANWQGYWPLGVDGTDRTSNSNDLTAFNTPTFGATGQVGKGVSLNGSDEYLSRASAVVSGTPMTFMAWFSTPDTSNLQGIMGVYDISSTSQWFSLDTNNGGIQARSRDSASAYANTSTTYSANTLSHATVVFASATSRSALLDDAGLDTGTDNSTPTGIDVTAIGRYNDSSVGAYFEGIVNDAQMHSAVRDADWRTEEYNQTNDNTTFSGTWDWTAGGGGTTYNEAIAESIGLTESQVALLEMPVAIAESIGLAETQATLIDMVIAQAESIGVSESQLANLDMLPAIAESIGVSETQAANLIISGAIAESVGVTESQSSLVDMVASIAESVGLTDAQSSLIDMIIAIAESVGLSDLQSLGSAIHNVTVSESIGLSETQAGTFTLVIGVNESIGLSETQSTIMTFAAAIAESIGLTDVATSGDLANGKLCVTISGSGPTISIVGTATKITITGTAPNVDITGEGC